MRKVDPAVFKPRPRVDSAILRLRRTGPGADAADAARWSAPPSPTAASRWPARSSTARAGLARRRPGRRSPSSGCPRTPGPRRSRPSSSPPCPRSCRPTPDRGCPRCSSTPPPSSTSASTSAPRRDDGLHELCSLFEPLALADLIAVAEAERDEVHLPRGRGREPGGARRWRRCASAAGSGPPLRIEIEKRVPVAAGLGGGSADAAAVLRLAAGEVADLRADRRRARRRRALAAAAGAGAGPRRRRAGRAAAGAGRRTRSSCCPTAAASAPPTVFAEADRLGLGREPEELEELAARLRAAAGAGASPLAYPELLVNDLEPAARSLRPAIGDALDALREAGAPVGAAQRLRARPRSGSSPTSPRPRAAAAAIDRDDAIVCAAGSVAP